MKKSILILSVILLLLTLGGVRLLSDRKKEYNISVSDITNEDFTKDVYQKNEFLQKLTYHIRLILL